MFSYFITFPLCLERCFLAIHSNRLSCFLYKTSKIKANLTLYNYSSLYGDIHLPGHFLLCSHTWLVRHSLFTHTRKQCFHKHQLIFFFRFLVQGNIKDLLSTYTLPDLQSTDWNKSISTGRRDVQFQMGQLLQITAPESTMSLVQLRGPKLRS